MVHHRLKPRIVEDFGTKCRYMRRRVVEGDDSREKDR
jgi:hypothetical protein